MLLNSHPKYRSAKTSNPDGPTPTFVGGRESTCLTFVCKDLLAAFIFAVGGNPGLSPQSGSFRVLEIWLPRPFIGVVFISQ